MVETARPPRAAEGQAVRRLQSELAEVCADTRASREQFETLEGKIQLLTLTVLELVTKVEQVRNLRRFAPEGLPSPSSAPRLGFR